MIPPMAIDNKEHPNVPQIMKGRRPARSKKKIEKQKPTRPTRLTIKLARKGIDSPACWKKYVCALLLNVVIRSCYRRAIGCRIVTYRRTMDCRSAIRGARFRGIEAEVARGTIGI